MSSQFVLGVFFTFFPYALPNVHLFSSHSSHVLSHFVCPIFLTLFLKFPWLPIMFPISNNLCQKPYYSLDNWAKMERLVCKVYFRCVQTLEISFLGGGCKLGNMFFCDGQANQQGPSQEEGFNLGTLEGWFFLSHGPSHPHKVAWYLKVMATFVSNLLEFVNLLDGCFGGRSWWKLLIWLFFPPCLCNVYLPL
jgi:hypothetical protein